MTALAICEAIDSSRDLVDGVQASAANRTSDIARVLTVVSGVMLPLTLIAGIRGMNFEPLPELRWEVSYPPSSA